MRVVEKVCIGAVVGALGIKGELRVHAFTAEPEGIGAYGAVETEDGRRFELRVLRRLKENTVSARIAGVVDRTQAEALIGTRLHVARAVLPPPDAEEFYHADLIGLDVVRPDGSPLGRVLAVQNFGAGDLLDIAPVAGGQSVLVPFTHAVVPEIDLAAGRIVAEPPAGLFEDDEADAGPPPESGP